MLFPTSLVGSYPQPDWLIDRERLRHRFPPRVRARELWRVGPAVPGQAQRGRDAARHPGAGAGGPGHHHRRRDPPGELLQPVRHRAGRGGHRQPGHRAGPQRAPEPGAAGHRADPAAAPGRGGGPGVPAREHQQDRQDHRARAVHHGPAGAERLLRQHRGARARVRRGGERGGAGPVRGRAPTSSSWTSRTCRRGRTRRAGTASRWSTGRWTGSPAPPPCTCASATRRSSTTARGLLVPARAGRRGLRPGVDRDRPVRPGLLGARRAGWQDDHPGRAQPGRPGGGERRAGGGPGPPGVALRARRASSCWRRTAG